MSNLKELMKKKAELSKQLDEINDEIGDCDTKDFVGTCYKNSNNVYLKLLNDDESYLQINVCNFENDHKTTYEVYIDECKIDNVRSPEDIDYIVISSDEFNEVMMKAFASMPIC